ncbi:MAG: hypothetical protein QOI00_340 [Chloroflexota bacterium]|jgi:hypothetical protein|nr:hypothetical protein [Chloroflexota bacterium]MEA2620857.1 hypothetical protein [Chloroflexota bacterium]
MSDLHVLVFLIVAPLVLTAYLVLCDRVRS